MVLLGKIAACVFSQLAMIVPVLNIFAVACVAGGDGRGDLRGVGCVLLQMVRMPTLRFENFDELLGSHQDKREMKKIVKRHFAEIQNETSLKNVPKKTAQDLKMWRSEEKYLTEKLMLMWHEAARKYSKDKEVKASSKVGEWGTNRKKYYHDILYAVKLKASEDEQIWDERESELELEQEPDPKQVVSEIV